MMNDFEFTVLLQEKIQHAVNRCLKTGKSVLVYKKQDSDKLYVTNKKCFHYYKAIKTLFARVNRVEKYEIRIIWYNEGQVIAHRKRRYLYAE